MNAPRAPAFVRATTQEVAAFLSESGWRYIDVLTAVVDLLQTFARTDEGRKVVYGLYSRGDRQRGRSEFKSAWQIKEKVNARRSAGEPTFAITDVNDIIGVTVVCTFRGMINHVSAFLEASDRNGSIRVVESEDKDEGGYLARHFVVALPDRRYADIRAEIQVKSILHDAWSRWAHDLIYKPRGSLPRTVRAVFESASKNLSNTDDLTQTFTQEVEHRWVWEVEKKEACRVSLANLLTRFEPADEPRRASYRDIIDDLKSNAEAYAEGDIDTIAEKIRAFSEEGYDEYSAWAMTFLAALRTRDDLDYLALDYIDRFLANPMHAGERISALTIKSLALFVFDHITAAIDVADTAEQLAVRERSETWITQCKANLAYYIAELGDARHAAWAKHLTRELIELRGGEDNVPQDELDSVGFVRIVFGDADEIRSGREICRRAYEADPDNPAAETFWRHHATLADERLEALGEPPKA